MAKSFEEKESWIGAIGKAMVRFTPFVLNDRRKSLSESSNSDSNISI